MFIVVLSFLFFFSFLLPDLTYASTTDSIKQSEKIEYETSEVQALSTGSCPGKFYGVDGEATATVQVAKTSNYRTLQWGLVLNPRAQSKFGSKVTVKLIASKVNYTSINPPYTPHTENPNYNFHGSLKNYQWLGKSGGGTLKASDRVFLNFSVRGSNGEADKVKIQCTLQ